jgi:hypothetical protein
MSDEYPINGLLSPNPTSDPETVAAIQLEALATNDEPLEDAGIGVFYNLASPANKRVTGPFERFTRMVVSQLAWI